MPKASVLFASSEVVGFAKTGGLGDVCGSLPPALAESGHRCAVIMPLFHSAKHGKQPVEPTDVVLRVPFDGSLIETRLWKSRLPDSEVPVWLVENAGFFERDDESNPGGFYQRKVAENRKEDYWDNWARFGFFCRAVAEALSHLDFFPDVVHANDWQTGLVPVYLREHFRHQPRYRAVRTVMTIHNIAFQGWFPADRMPGLGLDWRLFNMDQVEFYDGVSYLKAGIVFADRVTTVSPTYAKEIQTKYFGWGLHGVLFDRRHKLSGIVNGIDTKAWDPDTDAHLPAKYSASNLAGKATCKRELQRELGLTIDAEVPLFGVVARLAEQKGIGLLLGAVERLVGEAAQFAILGTGDEAYAFHLADLRDRFPNRIAVRLDYDEGLAHRIEAGSDLFLMPSLYEPCGLNQLYSLRYGTPPVVRATGGLADTVSAETGFSFVTPNSDALFETARGAIEMRRDRPEEFRKLIEAGMAQDWSWRRSAGEYSELYARLLSEREQSRTTSHRGRPW